MLLRFHKCMKGRYQWYRPFLYLRTDSKQAQEKMLLLFVVIVAVTPQVSTLCFGNWQSFISGNLLYTHFVTFFVVVSLFRVQVNYQDLLLLILIPVMFWQLLAQGRWQEFTQSLATFLYCWSLFVFVRGLVLVSLLNDRDIKNICRYLLFANLVLLTLCQSRTISLQENAGIQSLTILPLIVYWLIHSFRTGEGAGVYLSVKVFGSIAVLILLDSRSSWIGLVLSGLLWLLLTFKISFRSSIGLCVLLLGLFFGLLAYKSGSSTGRALIYSISVNAIKSRPLWGSGHNHFPSAYMASQKKYFQDTEISVFGRFADNTNVAFNELLNIVVEQGLAGTALVIVIISFYCVLCARSPSSGSNCKPTLLALISMIPGCLFSYPLQTEPTIAILIFFGAVWLGKRQGKQSIRQKSAKGVIVAMVILAAMLSLNAQRQLCYAKDWKQTYMIPDVRIGERIERMEGLRENLWWNPQFIYNYAYDRFLLGDYRTSLGCLMEIKELNNSDILWLIGENHFKMGEYDSAYDYFLSSYHAVPNRFKTLDRLRRASDLLGQQELAKKWASIIVSLPAKIPSSKITEIKDNAMSFLNSEEPKAKPISSE